MNIRNMTLGALALSGALSLVGCGGSDSDSSPISVSTPEPASSTQPPADPEMSPSPEPSSVPAAGAEAPLFSPARILVDNVHVECDESTDEGTARVYSFENADDISSDTTGPSLASGRWSRNGFTAGQFILARDSVLEFEPDQGNPAGSMAATIPFSENS